MRKLIAVLGLIILAVSAYGQNNTVKTAGITYTAGAPNWTPSERSSSEIGIDTTNGYLYQWNRNGSWVLLGQGIDVLVGASAPLYTPTRNQSWFAITTPTAPAIPKLYRYRTVGDTWDCLNCASGGGGGVSVTDRLSGDGDTVPLDIAQNGATTGQILSWTGTAWEPSWGNPYVFVTTSSTITDEENEMLIGTITGNITIGLPSCDADLDGKHFKFIKNGVDGFGVTIDPAGTETFYGGSLTKIFYGELSIDCTCRFSGTGVWFFDNF